MPVPDNDTKKFLSAEELMLHIQKMFSELPQRNIQYQPLYVFPGGTAVVQQLPHYRAISDEAISNNVNKKNIPAAPIHKLIGALSESIDENGKRLGRLFLLKALNETFREPQNIGLITCSL